MNVPLGTVFANPVTFKDSIKIHQACKCFAMKLRPYVPTYQKPEPHQIMLR